MKTIKNQTSRLFITFVALLALCAQIHAAAPTAIDLDAAIRAGDFDKYYASLSTYLTQRVPAAPSAISDMAMKALLKDPAFANALSQRQLLTKVGVANVGAFARADQDSKAFLTWLLSNTQAMDLYLEAATPTGLVAREENKWTMPIKSLEVWKKIYTADPESKDGKWLKLAIGAAINPPPAMSSYSNKPIDPVGRYQYFKAADKNNELVPSFRTLTAWEYSKLMNQGGPVASDEEFTWGREMIRTFRPDFLVNEQVVNIVSMVWRRGSPVPYTGMQTMLQGGGKCGPRSTFGVFINQAFGIPAIGVGQPKHACVAYKADPSLQPQPGSVWKVGYGGGWGVSKLEGLKGPDFVEGVEARMRTMQFSQVEHLRWIASALASKEQAGAVIGIAKKIGVDKTATKIDLNASLKAEEAEADPGTVAQSRFGKSKPATLAPIKPLAPIKTASTTQASGPFKPVNGVIHIDSASFTKTDGKGAWSNDRGVMVHDCFTGGKQVYFPQQQVFCWTEYSIDVPAAGTYEITMKTATINEDQVFDVTSSANNAAAKVTVPLSYGLWEVTKPADIKLDKGIQTIRVAVPTDHHQRGVAVRWIELKAK